MTTYLSLNGCPSIPWTFLPKAESGGGEIHTGSFTRLSVLGTPGKIQTFLPKGTPVTEEVECNIYFDFTCDFFLGSNVPIIIIPGKDSIWHYLRREGTYNRPKFDRELSFLRREVTFYKGYIMANQDPFEISKGGKLVAQRLFLNPLRLTGDEITGTPTAIESEEGFNVDNIEVNTVSVVNEDGVTFPEGTVIQFDCRAPGTLNDPLDFDEALLYFEFVTLAGLEIRISHPIKVLDAIEVR